MPPIRTAPAASLAVSGTETHTEVRHERSTSTRLTWRGSTVDPERTMSTGHAERCSARVQSRRGVSFAADTGDDVDVVRDLAARRLALTAARRPAFASVPPQHGSYTSVCGEDPATVDVHEKIDLLGRWHATAVRAHPSISGALLYYSETVRDQTLRTSVGGVVHHRTCDATLQLTLYAGDGSDLTSSSLSLGTSGDFGVFRDLEERIAEAAAVAVDTSRATVIDPGPYDVVCDGALAGTWVHETIGHLAEADHHVGDPELVAALSAGRTIGSPLLSVSDHPGRPGARGYTPVDDEGVAGVAVELLREGRIVRPRLHDRTTAAAFGETVTGNARALDAGHPPLPRLRTLEVAGGAGSREELVARTGHGLLAEGFHGGQTDRRGFSFTPAVVRRIVDGRIGPLVRGVVLTGETLGALARVDAVGASTWRGDTSAGCGKQGQYPLPVSSWSPPLRLRGVHVQAG